MPLTSERRTNWLHLQSFLPDRNSQMDTGTLLNCKLAANGNFPPAKACCQIPQPEDDNRKPSRSRRADGTRFSQVSTVY